MVPEDDLSTPKAENPLNGQQYEHAEIIKRQPKWKAPWNPDYIVDWLGTVIDPMFDCRGGSGAPYERYIPNRREICRAHSEHEATTSIPVIDEEYFHLTAVLEVAERAAKRKALTIVELGARCVLFGFIRKRTIMFIESLAISLEYKFGSL